MENQEINLIQALLESSISSQTSSTTSSSSSGMEYEKHGKIKNFSSLIEQYSDDDFKTHFRIKRSIAKSLIGKILIIGSTLKFYQIFC